MPSADEYKEQQKKTWNKFSGGWKKWDSLVMAFLAPTGAKIIEKAGLKAGDRVMDLATGTGEPGLMAAGVIGNGVVIGVDLAEDMLAVAKEKAVAQGKANYSVQAYDGAKLPFEDGSFDAIICRFGVIFSPEPVALLKEMLRTLKSGRKMSVSCWGPKEENPWASTAAGALGQHVSLPHPPPDAPGIFRYPDPAVLKKDMETAGVKNVEITQVTGELKFESAQLYWTYTSEVVAPVAMALAGLDADTRQKVDAAVLAACEKFMKNGELVFTWKSFVVSGEK